MNMVFNDILDQYIIIYHDDILVFSERPEQHTQNVQSVLDSLCQQGLYVKLKKYNFNQHIMEFLGYSLS